MKPLPPIEAIKSLHWGDGAAITFHRKVPPEGQWRELGAIALSEFSAKWPSITDVLRTDAYFSINSVYQPARCLRTSSTTGLPLYGRKAEYLRWLNCAVLDVDIYKIYPDCNRGKALEIFLAEIARSDVPPPSLICSSGRGVWGLWMLRDHKNFGSPVPAYEDRRNIYQSVNQALVKRFLHLGADDHCKDPSRVMRVPGSINSSAAPENCIVEFFRFGNDAYTLPELAHPLGVEAQKLPLRGERAKPKNAAKVKAGLMRWRVPLEGFLNLWSMRGQFALGVRRSAIYVYAALLRRNRIPGAEVLKRCLLLAESCSPVLAVNVVGRCVRSSRKLASQAFQRSISNATIARMLKITAAEKVQLSPWFKPKPKKKADQIAERRGLIARELALVGKSLGDREDWVSSRDMARLLAEKHGMNVSHVTVLTDFAFLYGQSKAFNPADFAAGKFPLLIDSKSSLVPAEKTYQNGNPTGEWACKQSYQMEPNNLRVAAARVEAAEA